MEKRLTAIAIFTLISLSAMAQEAMMVLDLVNKGRTYEEKERLVINQPPGIDALINRHILANHQKNGVDGWRIQIYRGGHRTANDDANKVRARFMGNFPELNTYLVFDKPNWFKVKVGDFRTREEAATVFFKIQAKYPDAYLIRDIIAFKGSAK
ncbi:MAG TPA: SPOR domain-containing protein [Bacteroidales bacterium]|nr:SPOR domain-containing protein [Bacteroidales bacterium]